MSNTAVPYFEIDARTWTHGDVRRAELDLCGMLLYGNAVCVNAAIEINLLDHNVAIRCVNGVQCIILGY